MKWIIFLCLSLSFIPALGALAPREDLEKDLKGSGLKGWIHGASQPLQLFVFTYRKPGNFFDHQEFPLVAGNDSVARTLPTLTRHDEVLLKGSFLANSAPIQHIWVEALEIIKKHGEPGAQENPYPYQTQLPDDLLHLKEIDGKVHAVAHQGKVLVIEYQDAVVPVVVGKPELAAGLYRNDKVHLAIKVRAHPSEPTHVSLDLTAAAPLKVIDRMVDWHGKTGSLKGHLVLFPKSPQVAFNVFALQVVDEQGIRREFTLVNFENEKVFTEIRQKLQDLWDSEPSGIENGRNKLINKKITITASGSFNVVDPGQANPQILLTGPEAIQLVKN
ncbi:hypothetical protein EBR78_01075 [bacterium]|nr:hypothetical protein [bacterium]NBX82039.1 hypothetical protein [bacterium]